MKWYDSSVSIDWSIGCIVAITSTNYAVEKLKHKPFISGMDPGTAVHIGHGSECAL